LTHYNIYVDNMLAHLNQDNNKRFRFSSVALPLAICMPPPLNSPFDSQILRVLANNRE